jgi:hypothetical protein
MPTECENLTDGAQEIPSAFEEMLKSASSEHVSKEELRSRSYLMKGDDDNTYILFDLRIYKATIL